MASTDLLLEKAQRYLRSAAVLLELEDADSCVSRAYFAMFFAARAVLEMDGSVPGRRQIRSTFLERYVDSGPLPDRAGDAFDRVNRLWELADYSGEGVDEEDAEAALQEAEAFVNSLDRLIMRRSETE